MRNSSSSHPVDKPLSACHLQKDADPVNPAPGKPNVLQHLSEERPRHRVKGFCYVNLQQHSHDPFLVQETTCKLYRPEIVMN
jgi:hypothetical protein